MSLFSQIVALLSPFWFPLIWQVLCFMFVIHVFELGTLNVSELKCILLHIEIENFIVIFLFFIYFLYCCVVVFDELSSSTTR